MAVPYIDATASAVSEPSEKNLLTQQHPSTSLQEDQIIVHNAIASSSRTPLDANAGSSRRPLSKKVERRVLPARIASSIANSASNSNPLSRELDDMVMECFTKAFFETFQPSDSLPIIITTEPRSLFCDSLLPPSAPKPTWWDSGFISFRRALETKPKRGIRTAQRPGETADVPPSPKISRSVKTEPASPVGTSNASNPTRSFRARALVKYTDFAVLKPTLMDTSDAAYDALLSKHELAERKDKLRETDKMIQARNKLKTRIEMLKTLEEHAWNERIEKLLKKAARYAGDEQARTFNASKEMSEDERPAYMKGRITEDELAEQLQRLILLVGMDLMKRKTPEELKQELIDDGKDLLHKYNKTLRLRGSKAAREEQMPRHAQTDEGDDNNIRSERNLRDRSHGSVSPATDDAHSERKRLKRNRPDTVAGNDKASPSSSPEVEPLPVDAAARSDGESVYEELQPIKPKKKPAQRRTIPRHVSRTASADTSADPAASAETVKVEVSLPQKEPMYLPLTTSGLPVLTEAGNKRLLIMKAEAERERLQKEAKSSRKKIPTMRSKSSRALTAPFGMPMPTIVGAHEDFDLDGPFWIPFFKARLQGGFTLESVRAQNGADDTLASLVPPQAPLPRQHELMKQSFENASVSQDVTTIAAAVPTSREPDIVIGAPPIAHSTNLSISPPSLLPISESKLNTEQPGVIMAGESGVSQAVVSSLHPIPTSRINHLPRPDTPDPFVYRRQEFNRSEQDEYDSDVVPDSQPANSDVIPSSWRTEDVVPGSGD
ncbi:hypothetical protein NliqN6_3009 [Naganishia liquefaciens]|uniref:Uncharacterized protein n=1 Tax=Naganishia liquefaciens TaxID=104408 RepID=A0A8H3YFW2_9TREE|nr:hypothetical protein NliqN6_3009 [Naganishia liquefaciens]